MLSEILVSSSCLPADCGAVSCSSSAADANGGDEGNDEGDAAATRLVYPGLKFCASRYTDRIYLYSKVQLLIIVSSVKNGGGSVMPILFKFKQISREIIKIFFLHCLRKVSLKSSMPAQLYDLLTAAKHLQFFPPLPISQQSTA